MSIRRRFILWNIVLWVVFLVIGLGVLTLVRQGGQIVQARAEANQYIEAAAAAMAENNWTQADRDLYRALLTNPAAAADVVLAFGLDLMVLPRTLDRLETELAEGGVSSSEEVYARGMLHLLDGDRTAARNDFSASAAEGYGPALEGAARLALDEGDWEEAQVLFAEYWERFPERRTERVARYVRGPADDPAAKVAAALGLFAEGFWDAALEYAERIRGTEGDVEGLAFFDALRADLNGDTAGAMRLYTALIEEAPDHYYASRRLAFLNSR